MLGLVQTQKWLPPNPEGAAPTKQVMQLKKFLEHWQGPSLSSETTAALAFGVLEPPPDLLKTLYHRQNTMSSRLVNPRFDPDTKLNHDGLKGFQVAAMRVKALPQMKSASK